MFISAEERERVARNCEMEIVRFYCPQKVLLCAESLIPELPRGLGCKCREGTLKPTAAGKSLNTPRKLMVHKGLGNAIHRTSTRGLTLPYPGQNHAHFYTNESASLQGCGGYRPHGHIISTTKIPHSHPKSREIVRGDADSEAEYPLLLGQTQGQGARAKKAN